MASRSPRENEKELAGEGAQVGNLRPPLLFEGDPQATRRWESWGLSGQRLGARGARARR